MLLGSWGLLHQEQRNPASRNGVAELVTVTTPPCCRCLSNEDRRTRHKDNQNNAACKQAYTM